MKHKILVGAALAACAGLAAAQSSVTVYGTVDIGLVYGKFSSAGSQKLLSPNTITSSRLGFSGSEDLGDGMRAGFQLENGFFPDTGAAAGGNTFFNRGSWVSLSGSPGEVRLGKQRSPMFWVFLNADISGYGIASLSAFNVLHGQDAMFRSGTTGFYDNMLDYRSPSFGGFQAEAAYTFGTEQAGSASHDGRTAALTLQYKNGPWWAGAGVQQFTMFETGVDHEQKTYLLGGRGVFGNVTVAADAIHATRDIVGKPTSSTGYGLQTKIHVGNGDIDAGVATMKEAGDRKAVALHLGYIHSLSKRTGVYVYAGKTRNNENASYTYASEVRNAAPLTPVGYDPEAIAFGIRHSF